MKKKVVRLTESDLIRIIKKVIKEGDESNESLQKFILGIKDYAYDYYNRENKVEWIQRNTPTRPDILNLSKIDPKYKDNYSYDMNKLNLTKPLEWVLYINGKEIDGSFFRIHKNKDGVYPYSAQTSSIKKELPGIYAEGNLNDINTALNIFNRYKK